AADVWGIGATLYETAVGNAPYNAEQTANPENTERTGTAYDRTTGDLQYPQLDTAAPPITSQRRLPHALATAIDNCLSQDPADRPTVPELTAALASLIPTLA
ncbi:serine/threonine protein kinase, partial [Streptomyces carpinensis]